MRAKPLDNALRRQPCRRAAVLLAWLGLALCSMQHPAISAAAPPQQAPEPGVTAQKQAPQALSFAPSLSVNGFQAVNIRSNLPEIQRLQDTRDAIVARHAPELVFHKDSELFNPPVLEQWRNLLKAMPSISKEKKLRYINGFFNNWPSIKDIDNYGVKEYWAPPEEFLAKGGDCEDYAIAKYFALKYLSWPQEDLWIVLVRNKENQDQHAVLAARSGDKTFILDNLSKPVYLILPAQLYMNQFTPLFAINEQGIWMFVRAKEQCALEEKKK